VYQVTCRGCGATINVCATASNSNEGNQSDYSDGPIHYNSDGPPCNHGGWHDDSLGSYVSARSGAPDQIQVHCPECWFLNVVPRVDVRFSR